MEPISPQPINIVITSQSFSDKPLGRALRKAVATFVFASGGVLIANPLFDWNVAPWELAIGTGLGALVNLGYRWAEKARDQ